MMQLHLHLQLHFVGIRINQQSLLIVFYYFLAADAIGPLP